MNRESQEPEEPQYLLRIRRPRELPADRAWVPCYWVESTAPINVDDDNPEQTAPAQPPAQGSALPAPQAPQAPQAAPSQVPDPKDVDATIAFYTEEGDADEMLQEIARHLLQQAQEGREPEIVITVHGFNNDRGDAWGRHFGAFLQVNSDPAIRERQNVVCLGYRWPSEKMSPSNLRSSLPALPGSGWMLLGATAASILGALTVAGPLQGGSLLERWLERGASRGLFGLGWALSLLPLGAVLLRALVYFRDVYRATHYAVPDLVELMGQLDVRLSLLGMPEQTRVKLSFVGHSMGAYVVTQLVRVLSNIFSASDRVALSSAQSKEALKRGEGMADASLEEPTLRLDDPRKQEAALNHVGQNFALERLVLVSPDIPAEALMTRRANYLGPCLRRFRECYLFSNEGDMVLYMVSTLANCFSFPARTRKSGLRLGNVQVTPPEANAAQANAAQANAARSFGIANLRRLQQSDQKGPMTTEEFFPYLQIGDIPFHKLGTHTHDAATHIPPDHSAPQPVIQPDADELEGKAAVKAADKLIAQGGAPEAAEKSLAKPPGKPARQPPELPMRFSFFDCTNYSDTPSTLSFDVANKEIYEDKKAAATLLLSIGRPKRQLSGWDQFNLLRQYVFKQWPDVHGGYFEAPFVRGLIYRLACIGIDDTLRQIQHEQDAPAASDPFEALDAGCRAHQLQVLLSPALYDREPAR